MRRTVKLGDKMAPAPLQAMVRKKFSLAPAVSGRFRNLTDDEIEGIETAIALDIEAGLATTKTEIEILVGDAKIYITYGYDLLDENAKVGLSELLVKYD